MAEKLEPTFVHEESFGSDVLPEQTPQQKAEAKRLLRKIDLLILPLCVLNYFFSSMDRSDIGNAKVAGFTSDNHLSAVQYSVIVSTFYAGYVIFQPIGGLSIRLIPPYMLLGCANIAWGIFTCLMALSTNIVLPSVLRVLVGAAEGLTEVNVLFLTLWYTHEEYAVRTGIWYSSGVLAGSFNGLIAYGIQSHHRGSLKPWQTLFLVEGCLPIAFGLVMIWLYPPVPEKVKKFFSADEKAMILARTRAARNTPGAPITLAGICSVFAQPQVYAMWLIYFCVIWTISGYNNFVPSIILGLGYSAVDSQLLTVPLSVLGFLSVNLFCYLSDRYQKRGPFVIGLTSVSFAGFAILVAVEPGASATRIGALCLVSAGTNPLIPLMLTWVNVNTAGLSRRAVAIPIQNSVGQVGGLCVSFVFIDPPRYLKGSIATLAVLGALFCLAAMLEVYFVLENRKKEANRDSDWCHENRWKTYEELGTEHPDFMYTL